MHIITMAKGARESSHGDWIRFPGARAKVEGCEKSLLKYLAALQRGARAKLSVLHTDTHTHTHTHTRSRRDFNEIFHARAMLLLYYVYGETVDVSIAVIHA